MNTFFIILLLVFILPCLGMVALMDRPYIRIKKRFKGCKDDIRLAGGQIIQDVIFLIEKTLHAKLPEYEVIMNNVPLIDGCTFCIYGTALLKFKERLSDEFIKLLEECNTAENKKMMKYDFINTKITFTIYQDAAILRMHFSEDCSYEKESDKPYIIFYEDRKFNESDRRWIEKMRRLDHYYKAPEPPDDAPLYNCVMTEEEVAENMKLLQIQPGDNKK